MPNCLKVGIDDILDDIWPTFLNYLRYELRLKQAEPYKEIEKDPKPFIILQPFYFIRNWHNYTMYPYDKRIWSQLKTYSWWFFKLFDIFPYFGVQSIYYLFVFLCIDKSEEYQLTNFILKYKKMQFISQGLIQTFLGYFLYFSCVSMQKKGDDAYSECLVKGPGSTKDRYQLYYDIGVFFLQLILVWMAYFLLLCSRSKGQHQWRYAKDDENQQKEKEKQKRCWGKHLLIRFLLYDLFTFGVSVGIYFWTFNEALSKDYDQSQPQIFMAKISYGFLSFPFLIFSVGFITNIITNIKPTAYDRYGHTVPAIYGINIQYKTQEKINQDNINQIFDVDIEEIFIK